MGGGASVQRVRGTLAVRLGTPPWVALRSSPGYVTPSLLAELAAETMNAAGAVVDIKRNRPAP